MKKKKWMAFALTLALSGATLTPAVYAETTAAETTATETTTAEAAVETTAAPTEKTKEDKSEQKDQKSKKNKNSKNNKNSKKKKGNKQKIDEPENAIGKDAAVEKALADAGLTAEQAGNIKARVSQLDDNTIVYKVKWTCNSLKYSYQINAVSGEVIEKSSEAVTEDSAKPTETGTVNDKDASQ